MAASDIKDIFHIFNIDTAPTSVTYLLRLDSIISSASDEFTRHHVLIVGCEAELQTTDIVKKLRSKCVYSTVESFINYGLLFRKLRRLKGQVILHELTNSLLVLYLLLNPNVCKRCSWLIWGGDLHFFLEPKTGYIGIKYKIIDKILRKNVIRRFKYILGQKSDLCAARHHYGLGENCLEAYYGMDLEAVAHNISIEKKLASKTIMVGHSGSKYNNHHTTLEVLRDKAPAGTNILCPLTYGSSSYIAEVESIGSQLFGENFKSIRNHQPFETYAEIISKVDAVVFNSPRQQGMGAIVLALLFGCRVFMRPEAAPYTWFTSLGVKIDDYEDLETFNFDELSMPVTVGDSNSRIIRTLYSKEVVSSVWRSVFLKISQKQTHGF